MFKRNKRRKVTSSRRSNNYTTGTRRVSSRLAKREQKKLVNQSVFFLLASILLGIIFVIFILPSSVNLFFRFLDSGEIVVEDDSLPPQIPIVSAPDEASSNAEITITGFAQIDTEVVLVLNANEFARVQVDDEGEFSIPVTLEKGKNIISLYAVSEKGKESQLSKEYEITYDDEAPQIELSGPEAGASFEGRDNQSIEVTGTTEPEARLYINERLAFANSEGEFKANVRLEEGENKITIKAVDKANNETEMELTVNFRL